MYYIIKMIGENYMGYMPLVNRYKQVNKEYAYRFEYNNTFCKAVLKDLISNGYPNAEIVRVK